MNGWIGRWVGRWMDEWVSERKDRNGKQTVGLWVRRPRAE